MYNLEQINEELKKNLSRERYIHCLNVANQAVELAGLYKADEESAFVAGVLHDIAKEMPYSKQLEILQNENYDPSTFTPKSNKIYHGWVGSVYAKNILNIQDKDILNAIRYHTTGRANMSLLERIVFASDCISLDRKYDGIEYFREACKVNLDIVIIDKLSNAMHKYIEKQKIIVQDTYEAYNYLVDYNNKKLERRYAK